MAIDFEKALAPHLVRERLTSLKAISGTDASLDELAAILSSLRGVELGIVIKERAHGKLKVDFAKEVPLKPEVAKAIVLETLAYRGAMIDDFQEKKPGGGFHTSGQIGVWYEKYAKKIDRLPMTNVDPALLDYGGYVASALRQAHGSMTSIGANTRVGEADANVAAPIGYVSDVWGGSRWGRWGGYGGVGFRTRRYSQSQQRQVQQRERTEIATTARIQGFSEANDIMTDVANATSEIRRQMTEKYNVDF